jgi:hypothetical protein
VGQIQERFQPGTLGGTKFLDGDPALRAADDGTQRDNDDIK